MFIFLRNNANSLCWYYIKPIHLGWMQSPATGKEDPFVTAQAGDSLRSIAAEKDPGNLSRQWIEHESTVCSGTPEMQPVAQQKWLSGSRSGGLINEEGQAGSRG